MMDHDQRFKAIIQVFFADFMALFFAPWAERLDTSAVEWLDKEVFPDPPEGDRHILDLVAKLPARQPVPGQRPGEAESWLALVHVEIESPDRATPLRSRMYRYYVHLRAKYGLPVLPIGLYLKVGLDGIGTDVYEEHFWELRPIRFEYLYVGLPALEGVKYVQGDNWLGVALAALMKIPKDQVVWLGAEALRRLVDAPLSDQNRYLLGECVQAYLPMDENQKHEYEKLVASEPFTKVKAMNLTSFEKGLEKGRVEGLEKGRLDSKRETIKEQLEDRFGPLPPSVLNRLEHMQLAELARLTKAVLRASSLKELDLEN